MKIAMMSRWNIPCGVSLHAELIGREWVKMGHDLQVLAPVELEGYRCDEDEPYVKRCYTLRKHQNKDDYFFDPKAFLKQNCDVFVVQNLEILPMEDLIKVYPLIREKAKTVLVVHEGKLPKDTIFYEFDWDTIVCFDERYKKFIRDICIENKIKVIPYPCHPVIHGDKVKARKRLDLPLDKKIVFNYGIGIYRHLHLLPILERLNQDYPLILLTLTHIQEWYDLFEAARGRYQFIELRKGDIPIRELYAYLHASDALLVHKDSAEAIVVPSTVNLCLGSGCPILAYNTNFFETFDKELIKYSGLGEALVDLFEESEKVKMTLRIAEQYVRKNSSYEIAKRFVELFESLPEMTEKRALA
jgi:hypothetical protein